MIERWITRALIALGPWALALAPAYLVWSGLQAQLWPAWLCWIVAAAVEIFGTSATGVALELRSYNQRKRKTDDAAPEATAWAIAGVYIVTISVFCGLHAFPGTEKLSLVLWPVMGASAMIVRALSKDHVQRLETIAAEKVERKAERAAARSERSEQRSEQPASEPERSEQIELTPEHIRVRDWFAQNAGATFRTAAQALEMPQTRVWNRVKELERAGVIKHNGHVEVL